MKKKRKTVTAPDMLLTMKGALYDLWLDTEERPRIPAAHRQVRKLIKHHLDDGYDMGAEREFIRLQKQIDAGLRSRDPEVDGIEIIQDAQKQLRKWYEDLFEAMFGVKPRRGE
jgi:hypothetical protein